MGNRVGSTRGTAYTGVGAQQPRDWHLFPRDPNQYDNGPQYNVGDEAQNTVTKTIWQLVSLAGNSTSAGALADWRMVTGGGGTVTTLTGDNAGVAVMPIAGNINIIADTILLNCGSSVSILGNNSDATLSLNVTDSHANTIIGEGAGKLGITGTNNTALGYFAMSALTTGEDNTGIGEDALADLTTGQHNTAVGYNSLVNVITGSYNIGLGNGAGGNYLGAESSNITIGAAGTTGESNVIRIGTQGSSSGQQNAAYIAGIYGTSLSGSPVVVTSTGQLGVGSGGGGTVTGFLTDDGNTVTPTAGIVQVAGGTGIVTTGTVGPNTITIAATGITTLKYTNVNHAASPYTVLTTDEYLSVDCSAGTVSLLFPNAATLSRAWVVKDRTGNAATNNITVTTVGGAVNIDSSTSFVMNTAYESINIIGNGTTYEVY